MPLVEIGQVFTDWKASFNYDTGSSAVTALMLASQRQTYTFTLANALPIDATLIKTDANPPRLKHWDELNGAVGLMRAFLARVADVSSMLSIYRCSKALNRTVNIGMPQKWGVRLGMPADALDSKARKRNLTKWNWFAAVAGGADHGTFSGD